MEVAVNAGVYYGVRPFICSKTHTDKYTVFVSFVFLSGAILAGLAVFKDSFAEQAQASKEFIPT